MADVVDRLRLVEEAGHDVGVRRELGVQDLERDLLADDRVLGEVDHAHAADAENAVDAPGPKTRAVRPDFQAGVPTIRVVDVECGVPTQGRGERVGVRVRRQQSQQGGAGFGVVPLQLGERLGQRGLRRIDTVIEQRQRARERMVRFLIHRIAFAVRTKARRARRCLRRRVRSIRTLGRDRGIRDAVSELRH